MKKLLLSLLIPFLVAAKDGIVKAKYQYSMSLYYETDLVNDSCRSIAFVNGKHLTCVCGGDPILIMIVYGHVQGFCYKHIPQIETNSGCDCTLKE